MKSDTKVRKNLGKYLVIGWLIIGFSVIGFQLYLTKRVKENPNKRLNFIEHQVPGSDNSKDSTGTP